MENIGNDVVVRQNWYDAQSRRIAKQEIVNGETKKWLYLSDGWNIIAVMNGNGQIVETFRRGSVAASRESAVNMIGGFLPKAATTNGTFYIHHNHRGDIVLTRSGTTTVGRYDYSAFGNLKSAIGNDVSRFKFSSKERDTSTGLSYYGYRFYSPSAAVAK